MLRYRLAPDSLHRPAAHLRGSVALDGSAQREVAVGLSARPVPDVPVSVAGELRLSRDAFGTRLRPVAPAITELAPIALPNGARAEVYAQAGHAGGKGATAFIDGQVRLDRHVLRASGAELRLGAGAWGGAQEAASRLDVGDACRTPWRRPIRTGRDRLALPRRRRCRAHFGTGVDPVRRFLTALLFSARAVVYPSRNPWTSIFPSPTFR